MTKKLIEVALPLEAINKESAREKSIRHGHPSTFHLWWARRPLAACRAVLFASIVDDPSAHPDQFPTPEAQQAERERLFRIIEALVDWANIVDARVLEAAQAELRASWGPEPPVVVDPFAGGGSIPLEAQRLGLETQGFDLNPVAALIGKALIELPARFSNEPPLSNDLSKLHHQTVRGEGLATDIRHYGRLLKEHAEKAIGHLYPPVTIGRSRLAPLTYIWARSVTCRNPACGVRTPLVRSFVLRSRGTKIWAEPETTSSGDLTFRVRTGETAPDGSTVTRRGAKCFRCGTGFSLEEVKESGLRGDLQPRLMAVVVDGSDGKRSIVEGGLEQEQAAAKAVPEWVPSEDLSTHPQYMGPPRYGLLTFGDLFSARQLVALTTFSQGVAIMRARVVEDGGSEVYADAIATYLALAVSRSADYWSTCAAWVNQGEFVGHTFVRQAVPMVWDFAEAVPFANASGSFAGAVEWIARAVDKVPASGKATVTQRDATGLSFARKVLISTDPPYYDNVPYADLSDYFYVWLRKTLSQIYPDLFSTLLTPKTPELVADQVRWGGRDGAKQHFEHGMGRVFQWMYEAQDPRYPLTIFYAFKQSETEGTTGNVASTGWETMLSGLIDAGFAIVGTWPMRTERSGRIRELGANALASSVVLVCRPRGATAPMTTRREFAVALRKELPEALRLLQQGNVAPVDLAQAAIGPGMAIFSRNQRVIEADGSPMGIRAALGMINEVLDELLAEQDGDFDPDTRWALPWFEEYGVNLGPFGTADTLARAKNTAVNALVQSGIVESRGGKVRLLRRDEMPLDWDPLQDRRLTVWESVQHLIRRLEERGEASAAELVRTLGGLGETARDLAYRLYVICERKGWANEALAYNGLVVAWPELRKLAQKSPDPEQDSLGL